VLAQAGGLIVITEQGGPALLRVARLRAPLGHEAVAVTQACELLLASPRRWCAFEAAARP